MKGSSIFAAARSDVFAADYGFAASYAAPVEYRKRKSWPRNPTPALTGLRSETRATTAQITKHASYERLTKRPADPCRTGDSQLASYMEKRLAFCESLKRKKHSQFRVVTRAFETFG
jgi:hypothetical protein